MFLVSGGTGFVGSAVVKYLLSQGEEVAVLGRDASKIRQKFGDVEARQADVRDPASLERAMQGIDVVINAVQFPTLTFTSSHVRLDSKGEGTVSGNLNLHGVTKPVTLKLKQIGAGKGMKGEQRVGYVATTTIKRTDFGMNYAVPAAATDEVDLRINIEAIKQ